MTYCLAINIDKGLVFASDSRTNAGVDHVAIYSKMHTYYWPDDRVCVLMTAGNLATSQSVINAINRDLEDSEVEFNLRRAKHLYQVADYVGRLSQEEQRRHQDAMASSNSSAEASFILGGQIAGQSPEVYLVYPQGNCIKSSPETLFLQIGETKYGKPILDRITTRNMKLEDAARCALVSLDSTVRSNLSVGPPLELAVYPRDSLTPPKQLKLDLDAPLYRDLREHWSEGLRQAFSQLPRFDWEH